MAGAGTDVEEGPGVRLMDEVGFVIRVVLTAVFAAGAVGKVRRPGRFVTTIRSIGISSRLAVPAAWMMIGTEALVAFLFGAGILPNLAAGVTSLLLALFGGVSLRAVRQHKVIPCNCFGVSSTPLGNSTLLRAILLLGADGCFLYANHGAGEAWWPESGEAIVPLLATAAAAILLARWVLEMPMLVNLIWRRREDEGRELSQGMV